jgi:hypothetical protein
LKTWFFRRQGRLYSLGTPDRREAEKRAYHLGLLLQAIFEPQDEPIADDAPPPHPTVSQEDTPC